MRRHHLLPRGLLPVRRHGVRARAVAGPGILLRRAARGGLQRAGVPGARVARPRHAHGPRGRLLPRVGEGEKAGYWGGKVQGVLLRGSRLRHTAALLFEDTGRLQ